ncbi:hypothetical protein BGS1_19785 [Clostridium beijerinckii]|nr:hypothetical protein BGS1_19785 [Clostridium beijerinckii]
MKQYKPNYICPYKKSNYDAIKILEDMLNSKKLIISMIEQLNMDKTCQLLYLLIGLLMLINIEN